MRTKTPWMSWDLIRSLVAKYPGAKGGLSVMTEEQFARQKMVRTRLVGGKKEYQLDLASSL